MSDPNPFPECGVPHKPPCQPVPTALPADHTDAQGNLTESGARWEQLHRDAAATAREKYFEEHPQHKDSFMKRWGHSLGVALGEAFDSR